MIPGASRSDRDDTIAAISTPAGAAPRGIARVSGPGAVALADARFTPNDGRPAIADAPTYTATEGMLHLGGQWPPVPAVAYVMRKPASYTREDIVELHVPGAVPVLNAVLERLLRDGARAAEPGEFTRRAFLNGRLDLAQAEAVMRLIHAQSDTEMRLALRQAGGSLSRAVGRLRDDTLALLAEVEAGIDFSDQEIEILDTDGLRRRLDTLHGRIARLLAAGESGGLVTELPHVQLVGRPNAGKSSLFNALAQRDRALVTDVPGTTRDLVDAAVHLDGIEVLLTDSAGITETDDAIEAEAVRRARGATEHADLLILVVDATRPFETVAETARALADRRSADQVILCLNKCDLPPVCDAADLSALWAGGDPEVVRTSALTGKGIEALSLAVSARLLCGHVDRSGAHFVLEARHRADLQRAAGALDRAGTAAPAEGIEFVALEIREAIDGMGDVLGLDVTESILDRIFAQFCIGK